MEEEEWLVLIGMVDLHRCMVLWYVMMEGFVYIWMGWVMMYTVQLLQIRNSISLGFDSIKLQAEIRNSRLMVSWEDGLLLEWDTYFFHVI